MKLSDILKRHFASDVRDRSAPYFNSRVFSISHQTKTSFRATVRGTVDYYVSIELDNARLYLSCTCPFFLDRNEGCKHLWASILMAEARNALATVLRNPKIKVIFVDDGEDLDDEWYIGEEEEEDYEHKPPGRRPTSSQAKKDAGARKVRPSPWNDVLGRIQESTIRLSGAQSSPVADNELQLLYVLDVPQSFTGDFVVLDVAHQERKKNGDWSKPKFQGLGQRQVEQIQTEPDMAIVPMLFGAQQQSYTYNYNYSSGSSRFHIFPALRRALMPLLGRTGRLFVRMTFDRDKIEPITWDDGSPWQLRLQVDGERDGKTYRVTGWFHRGDEKRSVLLPRALLSNIVVWHDSAAFFDRQAGTHAWLTALRKEGAIQVSAKKQDAFLRDLLLMPHLPPVDLPEALRVVEEHVTPLPKIVIRAPKHAHHMLTAGLTFEYAGRPISFSDPERGIYDAPTRRMFVRDREAERAAAAYLHNLGFRQAIDRSRPDIHFELLQRLLPKATLALLEAGWSVEAEGKLYRRSAEIKIDVTTGVDWFDLNGTVRFDDQITSLPRLLQALKKGETSIQLGDGTFGMLPSDWLKKYGMLAGLGTVKNDQLRFSRMQTGLLDALLGSLPEVSLDAAFQKAAQELKDFSGIKPVDPPDQFTGTLREYQREGLGWLRFLERFGFGGCLADDMGLGKTVQILALLAHQSNANSGRNKRPTLIVVPRSLVFNWKQEAARFTPHLKVLDHTGLSRGKSIEQFPDWDIILTTYGTLRRDVLLLKDAKFNYCILDEAQTVKNADTDQAKAVRLLQADHRLALSGTPIENHLGELWSLFEFLNPGMLGHASLFKLAGGAARNPDPETRALLAKGLRPYILRRTKNQVAKDLPEKNEQTLYCELEAEQRQLYDELRDHYRQSLLQKIESVGMNRAKIQVLEALLRLRQAACHPGLIDKNKVGASSAKLDMLLPQLRETMAEGQKTLVFSQFTSLLAIVRTMLDRESIRYEYLDGRTRKRQERVEHFQNDPDCKLFLISLKAGGVGLNLTAAEYVFLLDPWWNPAVEAQAIDRTHRIGQTKPVFAYRLIAKNTVEEKVLELQNSKRNLADAILTEDNSVLSNLKREDLEMLLS